MHSGTCLTEKPWEQPTNGRPPFFDFSPRSSHDPRYPVPPPTWARVASTSSDAVKTKRMPAVRHVRRARPCVCSKGGRTGGAKIASTQNERVHDTTKQPFCWLCLATQTYFRPVPRQKYSLKHRDAVPCVMDVAHLMAHVSRLHLPRALSPHSLCPFLCPLCPSAFAPSLPSARHFSKRAPSSHSLGVPAW